MWYKEYGQTGKKISAVSFGGMRFPNPDDIGASAEIVRYAYGKGVNYFDTAPYYCKDKSEEIMGAAFKGMKAGTFYASTKCSEADGGKLRAQLETSLTRLGLQRVSFYHIWWVLNMDAWKQRVAGGAVAAAIKAKEEGLIEHLTISSHMAGAELAEVLKQAPFDGVTLGYCAINFPYRQQAVDAAGKMNLGVVTMNPLGGGLIPQHAQKFDFIRGPQDRNVIEAAIRFNVSQPAITAALVGFSSNEQVDQGVAAVENFQPYATEHVESIRTKVMGMFNDLCTGCGYCQPCPLEINVPQMMDAYNIKMLEGKDQAMLDRLKWHWGTTNEAAKSCSLCGKCEARCTQHLPIRERMKKIASLLWPEK